MKDIFVSKETAKKLKEIGFNEPCMAYYLDNETYNGLYATNIETDESFALLEDTLVIDNHNSENDNISAPTYEQVFKWFREKKIIASITPFFNIKEEFKYYYYLINDIRNEKGGKLYGNSKYTNYEEAQNSATLKLIEIYKKK